MKRPYISRDFINNLGIPESIQNNYYFYAASTIFDEHQHDEDEAIFAYSEECGIKKIKCMLKQQHNKHSIYQYYVLTVDAEGVTIYQNGLIGEEVKRFVIVASNCVKITTTTTSFDTLETFETKKYYNTLGNSISETEIAKLVLTNH